MLNKIYFLPILLLLTFALSLHTINSTYKNKRVSKPGDLTSNVSNPDKSKGYWKDILMGNLSPNGKYLAYWSDNARESVYTIEFSIDGQSVGNSVQRESRTALWSYPKPEKFSYNELISWSPDGKHLAAVTGNKFLVIEINSIGPSDGYAEVINPKVLYEGDLQGEPSGDIGVWFEDERLIGSFDDGVFEIWPDSKNIKEFTNRTGSYPKKGGFLFWQNSEECCEVKLMEFDYETGNSSYTGVTVTDYGGKVLANNSGDKICLETGSSGYYGFVLHNLKTKETVSSGQQYSYCGQWIGDNEISIVEVPYFNQWSEQVYIYNFQTGNYKPVVNLGNDWTNNPYAIKN